MTLYRYYLFDPTDRLVNADAENCVDLLSALEHLKTLLDRDARAFRIEMWHEDHPVGHIERGDGRIVLIRDRDIQADLPARQTRRRQSKAS